MGKGMKIMVHSWGDLRNTYTYIDKPLLDRLGLKSYGTIIMGSMVVTVVDESLFMLAVIRYGIQWEEFKTQSCRILENRL